MAKVTITIEDNPVLPNDIQIVCESDPPWNVRRGRTQEETMRNLVAEGSTAQTAAAFMLIDTLGTARLADLVVADERPPPPGG